MLSAMGYKAATLNNIVEKLRARGTSVYKQLDNFKFKDPT